MAKEQYKRNCKLFDDMSDPAIQKFIADSAKTGDRTSELPNNSDVVIGPGNFDTSDALAGGGSGCIADMTVTVAGHAATLPFSKVCGPLVLLGNVLLMCSFLLAGRIVLRG